MFFKILEPYFIVTYCIPNVAMVLDGYRDIKPELDFDICNLSVKIQQIDFSPKYIWKIVYYQELSLIQNYLVSRVYS